MSVDRGCFVRVFVVLFLGAVLGCGFAYAQPAPDGEGWSALSSIAAGLPQDDSCLTFSAPEGGSYVEIAQCTAGYTYPGYDPEPGYCELRAAPAGGSEAVCARSIPTDETQEVWVTVATAWHWRPVGDGRKITVADAVQANWLVLSVWCAAMSFVFIAKTFWRAGDQ